MSKELEKIKERLNDFKSIKILYGNTFAMHIEQLNQLQNDIEDVLNYIDNSISKEEHKKLKEHCKTLIKEKQELTSALLESIPKEVIEKKIEELDKLIIETQKELGTASKEYTIYVYQKAALQELLEGK